MQQSATIQSVIDNAEPNSKIAIKHALNLSDPTQVFHENLVIDKPIHLVGHGVILNSSPETPAIKVDTEGIVNLLGFTIQSRTTELEGTGIYSDSETKLTIFNCKIREFSRGILATDGTLDLDHNDITATNSPCVDYAACGISLKNVLARITNNSIYMTTSADKPLGVSVQNSKLEISDNRIIIQPFDSYHDDEGIGISLTDCYGTVTENDLFVKNSDAMMFRAKTALQKPQTLVIENNFVVTNWGAIHYSQKTENGVQIEIQENTIIKMPKERDY